MASVFDSSEEPLMPNPVSPSKTQHENPQTPMDGDVDVDDEELKSDFNVENGSRTEMVEDGERSPKSRGRPKKKDKLKQPTKPGMESRCDRVNYSCPLQDEAREVFAPADLVWGKVRSHPWWPGLIVDPADASELALKHRNRNNYLVAYFFDNTFAWNEASVLKPFQSSFGCMVKQSSTDNFVSAIGEVMAEVSRRVGCALTCGCYDSGEKNFAEVKFENAGVRTGTVVSSGDVMFVRKSFHPVKFLGYLRELGQNPHVGFESLDLVVAKSQLKAFNRSRGCSSELPEFGFSSAFEEETVSPVTSDRIYTRKHKSIDGESSEKLVRKKSVPEEGTKKKTLSEIFNKEVIPRTPVKPSKVRVGGPSDSDTLVKTKKRSLDSLGDLGTKSKARRKYLRVGQCMRKAENQVTHCTPTPKPNGITSRKRKRLSMIKDRTENEDKPLQREKGVVVSVKSSRGKSGRKKKEVSKRREIDVDSSGLDDYPSSSEMFSRLCLAAQDPLQGCSFNTMVISFLARFRDYVVDPSTSRRTLVEDDDDNDDDDDDGDDDDEKLITLRQKKQKSRKGHKENILEGISATPFSNQSEDLGNEKQENDSGVSDTDGHKPIPESEEESMPTALVLNFKEAAPLPTEPELNGLFTRFGPLKEAETEVSEKENSAQVIFERHVDAEAAFTNAGELDAIGADLVNCELSRAPNSSSKESTAPQVELQAEKDVATPIKAAC